VGCCSAGSRCDASPDQHVVWLQVSVKISVQMHVGEGLNDLVPDPSDHGVRETARCKLLLAASSRRASQSRKRRWFSYRVQELRIY